MLGTSAVDIDHAYQVSCNLSKTVAIIPSINRPTYQLCWLLWILPLNCECVFFQGCNYHRGKNLHTASYTFDFFFVFFIILSFIILYIMLSTVNVCFHEWPGTKGSILISMQFYGKKVATLIYFMEKWNSSSSMAQIKAFLCCLTVGKQLEYQENSYLSDLMISNLSHIQKLGIEPKHHWSTMFADFHEQIQLFTRLEKYLLLSSLQFLKMFTRLSVQNSH